MKTVPITIGFDNTRIIGFAEIDLAKLPKDFDYCFSIGVMLDSGNSELIQLALVSNDSHLSYLNSEQRKRHNDQNI